MKIRQWILGLTAVCGMAAVPSPVSAQNFATVTQGEKGKFYILTGTMGVRGGYLSADGMFMGGSAGGDWSVNVGYVYDIARDSLKVTTSADVVKSWTVYAGNNTIQRDGQTIEIESLYPDKTNAEMAHASIWAASASLDTIVTMGYELVDDPTGERPGGVTINLPYLVDGKTGKIIHRIKGHWPLTALSSLGYGARVNAASNDATVLAGHSSRPSGAQWAPVFWDIKADTSFFVGTDEADYGDLNCTNNDGTLIGGSARGKSIIIHYDKENLSYDIEEIPDAPGKSGSLVNGITETGLVLCVQASAGDIGSREAYIYDMEAKTLASLKEYVRELYGLELPIPTFTAFSISDDGRKVTGWSSSGGVDVPYLIELDETQIFAKPRSLSAIQPYGAMTVNVSWTAPLRGQYTLKGYNVYCDEVKLNVALIDKTVSSFEHADVTPGVHDYKVQAVYEEGVSDYCAPFSMLVIAGDGCLPVQEIGNHLIYNRKVEIYWGLPSAQMVQPVNPKSAAVDNLVNLIVGGEAPGRDVVEADPSKSYRNENMDLIGYRNFGSYLWSCAILMENRLYAAQYNSPLLTVFNPDDMSVIETFAIAGVPAIRNMVYQGGKLYLATGEEKIVVVDFKTMTISNELQTKGVSVQHIAYIPTLNDGKGGFAYGDYGSLQYCDLYGRALTAGVPEVDIKDLLIAGTAWHNGWFYIFSQTGRPQKAEIYTIDFKDGRYLRKRNLGDIRRLAELDPYGYGFLAGGLTVNTLQDGTVALAPMLQLSADFSHWALLEVEASENLLGYNLYRSKDGGESVRVNPEGQYIRGLSYSEDLMEPGKYVYTVEAVNEGGCASMLPNVKTEVSIVPIGECVPPVTVRAVEQAKAVRLDWDYERVADGPGLVGFNVYRGDELLTEHLVDLKYTDFNMSKGNYTYRVEAFYDNSCVASKTVNIKVTHEGVAMPPAHLILSAAETVGQSKHYDVTATWELPYFETPLALGYSNMPYSGTGLQDKVPVYALIGWDAERLEPFKNLYVIGIEYFIGEGIETVEGLVYLNDTLAYKCPGPARIRENDWNTLLFDRYIPMDQPMEVCVGYKVTYSDEMKPVAVFDLGPAEAGFGDLISGDGLQWGTLSGSGLDANWCINALVVDKRDLEEAVASVSADGISAKPVVKVMSLNKMQLSQPQPVRAAKSNSESVKLQGFNIYREDQRLNADLLKTFSYQDLNVPEELYEYVVSAVYSDGGEVKGTGKVIDLGKVDNLPETLAEAVDVFPNPSCGIFHVQGYYTCMEILDLSGSIVRRYEGNRADIDATGLPAGLYVLRFTLPDGTCRWRKIVLE